MGYFCCTVIFVVATMENDFINVRFLVTSLDGRAWIILMLLIVTTFWLEGMHLAATVIVSFSHMNCDPATGGIDRQPNHCDHLWQWLRDGF